MSPFNAWVLLKGLETLPIRVERQGRTAEAIADFMARLPGVTRVLYPGGRTTRRPIWLAAR